METFPTNRYHEFLARFTLRTQWSGSIAQVYTPSRVPCFTVILFNKHLYLRVMQKWNYWVNNCCVFGDLIRRSRATVSVVNKFLVHVAWIIVEIIVKFIIPWVATYARWLPRKLQDRFPVLLRLHRFILCTNRSGGTAKGFYSSSPGCLRMESWRIAL